MGEGHEIDGHFTGQRVLLGAGARTAAGEEVARLGAARALVLSTPEQRVEAEALDVILGPRAVGLYAQAAMHTPVDVTEDAMAHLRDAQAIVAIGGGSTIGLGKALALRTGLPVVAIPTTYAGSEARPILGQTDGGEKTTLTDPAVRPRTVIYDPELVATLPHALTVTSALNAMAHAAEALYAADRTDASDALALEGLRAFVESLPRVVAAPDDLDARAATLRGAYACGAVLGRVGMALHHKLCHALGGAFGLPHAETHAVVLPHALAYNEGPELAPLADLLGADTAAASLWRLAGDLGAPWSLRELGLAEGDLDRAAVLASSKPYPNPRPVTAAGLTHLLGAAWRGEAPRPIVLEETHT